MTHLLDYLADRVLLCDGPIGTQVQGRNLDIERDFHGHENCTDILTDSRPDLVLEIHRDYLAAGCEAVQTNSFGASPITLGEFGIGDRAFDLNRRSAELAREAVAEFAHDGRTRFVFGSVGPGTRLPSLGHIAYQDLEDALTVQCAGLVAGGVDAIRIETCQDPLQIKAAVNGAKRAREAAGKDIPIIVQVTVETTGTLLVGADIAAAATIIHALDVPAIGLNCATGPREMAEHVKWLGDNWPGYLSVLPNAGLPELINGHTHYPLTPRELAQWLERFVIEDGVNMIGGCCGSEAAHIAAHQTREAKIDQTHEEVQRQHRTRAEAFGHQPAHVVQASRERDLAIELHGSGVTAHEAVTYAKERNFEREAVVDEQWLYRWLLPEDTSGLERLIDSLIEGRVDALAVTCQVQFRHLLQVARRVGLERELIRALNERIVVAAVGPTCQAILQVHGVEVDVVPDHPKMGPLVASLMRHLEQSAVPSRGKVGA